MIAHSEALFVGGSNGRNLLFFLLVSLAVSFAAPDKNISLTVILPYGGTSVWCDGHGIQPAIEMVQNIVNKRKLLPGYQLTLNYYNGLCNETGGLQAFIETVKESDKRSIVGILGPGCSAAAKAIGAVSRYYPLVSVSYAAESPDLSKNELYPYFLRTAPEAADIQLSWLALVKYYGWRRFAVIVQKDNAGFSTPRLEQAVIADDYLEWSEVMLINSFGSGADWNPEMVVDELKANDIRIIIAIVIEEDARSLFCEARHQGLTGCCSGKSYVWILPGWFHRDWWNGGSCQVTHHNLTCTPEEIQDSAEGYLVAGYQFYTPKKDTKVEGNFTVSEWKTMYTSYLQEHRTLLEEHGFQDVNVAVQPSDYATFAYDAMFTWIKALQIYLEEGNRLEFISIRNESASMKLKEIMENITFHGISGLVQFKGNNRISNFSVGNYISGEVHQIGGYDIDNKKVYMYEVPVWGKCCDNAVPPDQYGQEDHAHDCLGLESLSEKLGECASAVALVFSAGFCGLLVLLIILFIIYHRRFAGTKQRMQELGLMENFKRSSALLVVDEFEIPRSKLQLNRKLGEGCFGHVYGGEAIGVTPGEDRTPVAVKTLRPEAEPVDKLLFLEEVYIMKQLDHINIVRLIGVCTKGEPIFAVMELMVYGDLRLYLLSHRHCLLSEDLYRMAVDVGNAVQYMHSVMYIHRDIASRNCMVTLNRRTKLGDFGMTRKIDDPSDYYRYQKMGLLPVRWMAPESLSHGVFSFPSDVWSFGILLYEIITVAGFPYQGLSNFEVVEKVPKGLTVKLPRLCPAEFSALVRKCWCFDSELRPSMDTVVSRMEGTEPSQLFRPCTDARPEIISTSDDYPDGCSGGARLTNSAVPEKSNRSLIRRYSHDILSGNVSSIKRRPSTASADAATQNALSSSTSFRKAPSTIPSTQNFRQELVKESSV